jgi:hypothetical protein
MSTLKFNRLAWDDIKRQHDPQSGFSTGFPLSSGKPFGKGQYIFFEFNQVMFENKK